MQKKILIISPYFPYPPFDGGKNRIFNLIKHLSAKNDIYLLSYIEPGKSFSDINEMGKMCKKVYAVERDESKMILGADIPRSISFCYTPEMVEMLGRVITEVNPDIVQIEFLVMTRYLHHLKGLPAIYTEHDISNINFEQSFHDRDLPEHLRFIEWHRLVKYEKKILGMFDAIIVLTERDQKILKEFSPASKSTLIPTGVDTGYYSFRSEDIGDDNLVFVGNYRHYPNYDAFKYFVCEIFPEIVKKRENSKFFAVGSGVIGDMKKFASENVIITGEIEDIRPFLKKAAVFVAPVRLGGGIKGKILEAMASGVPVVATKEAGSGIKCLNGRDILISNNNEEFINNTIDLLGNGQKRKNISRNARSLVEKNYDWKNIADELDLFYDRFVQT